MTLLVMESCVRVQLAAAAFVLGRYAHMPDVIKLGWIPTKEGRENHILLNTFKALSVTMTGRPI